MESMPGADPSRSAEPVELFGPAPRWVRLALAAVVGLSVLGYAWGASSDILEPFYGAAARSMSQSWHDFFFGAFDPMGTVTVDKLPGALWVQALSLRAFGFHIWAVVLPQMVEGALTVLVLYRGVRELAGWVAGLAAALVMAATPVVMTLARGNVSDSLLTLLTVLAAASAARAVTTGRLRLLVLAGLWVGLAFQAKMVQAWLVLPALFVVYLLAAPGSRTVRIRHVIVSGLVAAIVSVSWMTAVTLVPAQNRPYFDGSTNNSVFAQVFDYNGIARLRSGRVSVLSSAGASPSFLSDLADAGAALNNEAPRIGPSWHRVLSGLFARDGSWLAPGALVAALGILWSRRKRPREDPLRASVILWGTWLAVLLVFFSIGSYLNAYYIAALAPAFAALCGTGVSAVVRRRTPVSLGVAAAASAVTVMYGIWLLSGGHGVPAGLVPAAWIAIGLLALSCLAAALRRSPRSTAVLVAVALLAALVIPSVTSGLAVDRGLGPFDAPFQPASATAITRGAFLADGRRAGMVVDVAHQRAPGLIAFAVDTSAVASIYVLFSGREVLPIGGFLGGVPEPTVARLRGYVLGGRLREIVVPVVPVSSDARVVWVRTHCYGLPQPAGSQAPVQSRAPIESQAPVQSQVPVESQAHGVSRTHGVSSRQPVRFGIFFCSAYTIAHGGRIR
jgi:4-amino-4-deoxy-L-arabinose transferase-like glycosyltransferase